MNVNEFKAVVEFLGEDITEEQCGRLMDQAKQELSRDDLQELYLTMSGQMYTELSMYNGEMGGLGRY